MSVRPQVSIVMPVYNGEPFVEAAIQSILAQDGSFEIILHDDGSTDGTLRLLDAHHRQDPRISLSSGPNQGPAAARNRCLARARGDFVAFLDHDDLWPPRRLQRQIDILAANPSAGMVLGHTLMFEHLDVDGRPAPSARSRRVLAGLLQAGLFRKQALDPLGGFDTGFVAADDFDFLLRLVEGPWTREIDPEIALYYRLHAMQWTADPQFAAAHTLRALHRSLQRRRRSGVGAPLKRL